MHVITITIIKRTCANIIMTADKINTSTTEMQKKKFTDRLDITISCDMSKDTRTTLHDLINTLIIGFILVTIVLIFFMGVTHALFVALSVPLSMFIAFLVMPAIDFSFNMMVLFS